MQAVSVTCVPGMLTPHKKNSCFGLYVLFPCQGTLQAFINAFLGSTDPLGYRAFGLIVTVDDAGQHILLTS